MYQELNLFTNKQEIEYLLKLLEQDKQNCERELEDANRNLRIEISTLLNKFK